MFAAGDQPSARRVGAIVARVKVSPLPISPRNSGVRLGADARVGAEEEPQPSGRMSGVLAHLPSVKRREVGFRAVEHHQWLTLVVDHLGNRVRVDAGQRSAYKVGNPRDGRLGAFLACERSSLERVSRG